jgi:hypothetical protein
MLAAAAENGLQAILAAVGQHIPPHAMPVLEQTIRTYGDLRASDAMIEYLAKKMEG